MNSLSGISAIILDRDGVINQDSPDYIKHVDELHLFDTSIQAIAKLHLAGLKVFIITNQSGIGRGLYSEQTLTAMHRKLYSAVIAAGGDIQAIYYCPHHPDEKCLCRKPKTTLFERLSVEHKIDLSNAYYIGDKITDVQAALAVNATPVLVLTGKGKQYQDDPLLQANNVQIYNDLNAFSIALLNCN